MKKYAYLWSLIIFILIVTRVAADDSDQVNANSEEKIVVTGSCGTDLVFKITGTISTGYTLTITGTGDMTDFSAAPSYSYSDKDDYDSYDFNTYTPWSNYMKYVVKVNIGEGVTSIGNNAFHGFVKLTEVNIPNNVTKIGQCAFAHCKRLVSISMPDTVTYLGSEAFRYCDNLRTIRISNGLGEIYSNTFDSLINLKCINIPEGVTSLYGYVFGWDENLTSIILPKTIKRISDVVFWKVTTLTDIYYCGTQEEWLNVDFSGNEEVLNATIHYNYMRDTEHVWNAGTVIRKATQTEIGIKEFNCTNAGCVETKAECIPTVTPTSTPTPTPTSTPTPTPTQTETLEISVKSTIRKAYKKNGTFSLGAKSTGKLSYKSSKKSVVTVSSKGKVTIKGYGSAKITITAKKNGKTVSQKVTIKIIPASVKLISVSKSKKNTAEVVWKRDKSINGYEVQYSSSKKFSKSKTRTGIISKNPPNVRLSLSISNLSKGTTYIRMRSYKVVSGKKIYGFWSKTKKITIK